MQNQNLIIIQPQNLPQNREPIEIPDIPNGTHPIGVILAISILIRAIAKLIEVLIPVMLKNSE